jgi:hypothetical protein
MARRSPPELLLARPKQSNLPCVLFIVIGPSWDSI